MQIATKPGIGAPRHFCQTIISPVVWALNKQAFPPRRVLPSPFPLGFSCTHQHLHCSASIFFFFPLRAWHNVQQSSLRSPADKLWVSFGLCWTRGNSCGRLLARCPGTLPAWGSANLGAQSAAGASGSREVWRSWWSVLLAQGFSLSRLFASSSSNGTFCSAPIVSLGSNKPSKHLSWRLWHSNCFNGKLVPAQEACCHQSFL